MKLRESNLEKENMYKVKEKQKTAKEIFDKMYPEIKIFRPLGIFFNLNEKKFKLIIFMMTKMERKIKY